MMNTVRHLLIAATLVVAPAALLCPCSTVSTAQAQQPQQARRVVLHVEGMSCASCSAAVKVRLERIDGVAEARVLLADKRAHVKFDPARVTPARMVEEINDMGYRARVEDSR